MKAYVAVTDKGWFEHLRILSRHGRVQEVNFWTPRKWGGRFGVLERGQPLLFKLKSPDNAIVGGGFFEHYSELPIGLSWQAFGEKNGASRLAEIRERTARLRKDHRAVGGLRSRLVVPRAGGKASNRVREPLHCSFVAPMRDISPSRTRLPSPRASGGDPWAGATLESRWAARALSGRWLAKGADEETELDVVRDHSHTCWAGTSRKRLRR